MMVIEADGVVFLLMRSGMEMKNAAFVLLLLYYGNVYICQDFRSWQWNMMDSMTQLMIFLSNVAVPLQSFTASTAPFEALSYVWALFATRCWFELVQAHFSSPITWLAR
jgi:hypothetical protein